MTDTFSIMETDEGVTDSVARAALLEVEVGRSAAARRVTTPWWFHPLQGATLAAMLGAFSLRGLAVTVVLVLALAAQVGLFVLYRRLTGLWVNTWHVKGMRQPTAIAIAVAELLGALSVGLDRGADVLGASAVGGVVLGVAYVVYWRWVERRLVMLWTAAP